MSAADPLALGRFEVPPISADLVDRIVAAATDGRTGPGRRPRRDSRGLWRRGRHVMLATAAAGLLSAGAVASGLLGRAGIEIPVLTAMLAPAAQHSVRAHHVRKLIAKEHTATPTKAKSAPVPTVIEPPAPVIAAPQPSVAQLVNRQLVIERREKRRAFALAYPRVFEAMRRSVQQQMWARALAREGAPGQSASTLTGEDSLPLAADTGLGATRVAAADRRRADAMLDRRIARFVAVSRRIPSGLGSAGDRLVAPPSAADADRNALRTARQHDALARRNLRRLRNGLPPILQ